MAASSTLPDRFAIPVTVVRAKQTDLRDFKGSPTWPGLASIIPNGTDIYRPDRTHFHPFEDPEDAAKINRRCTDGLGVFDGVQEVSVIRADPCKFFGRRPGTVAFDGFCKSTIELHHRRTHRIVGRHTAR